MHKRRQSNIFSLIILIVGLFIYSSSYTLAKEDTKDAVGFNYSIDYPSNQIGGESGYFDLNLSPGTEQTVILKLRNSKDSNTTVNLSLNGTKTNSNGVLEYGPTEIKNDSSLKFPFEKVVSAPKKVELNPKEIKDVPIKIKMPETSFDGMILGGIHMKTADAEENEGGNGATVKNTYSYIVAMKLQNSKTEIDPEIKTNKAMGEQQNYRNSVLINLSNISPALVKNKLDIESQITKKGSKEVLYERKQSGMSIAPNSQMDFFVSMTGEQMVPGDYTASVLAKIGNKKWEKNLNFTITKEEADKYNKRDVGLVQDRGINWKLIIFFIVGFLILVGIIFLIIKFTEGHQSVINI